MTGPETLDVARDAIWTIVIVSSPLMIVGLVVGVVVSLFQALTQIQEQTLVFVPKILAIFVTLLLALPFMADASGNVKYPNVNSLVEMTDMRDAQRSYEANVNIISATRRMIQRTLDILKA